MAVKKTLGIVLAVVGVLGVAAWAFPEAQSQVPNFSELLNVIGGEIGLIIISACLVLVGIFLIMKGGRRGKMVQREVPIFSGKDVVGYRRH